MVDVIYNTVRRFCIVLEQSEYANPTLAYYRLVGLRNLLIKGRHFINWVKLLHGSGPDKKTKCQEVEISHCFCGSDDYLIYISYSNCMRHVIYNRSEVFVSLSHRTYLTPLCYNRVNM